MKISIKNLGELILKSLKLKYSIEDAKNICDVILFGELSEKTTHGIVRLLIGNASVLAQNPKGKPIAKKITSVSTLIDGNGNPGMLVGPLAMNEAMQLAKTHGIGIVGTNKSFSSSGCLSYYAEIIAQNNLIGIIMAHSPPSTAPHGGIEPLFGTNPIGFGIPARPRPLIFDMATSAISFGAILKAATLGHELSENCAIDSAGNSTTDPKKAMEGATLPFDSSYKGAGLAMMVEILAGAMPGADFVGQNPEAGWGNLFIVFSPTLFGNLEQFKQNVYTLVQRVRNSKTKDGHKIRIVGENTIAKRNINLEKGKIDIEDKLYQELKQSAKIN